MENKYEWYFVIKEDYLLDESISLMLIKCYQVIKNKKNLFKHEDYHF